MGLKDLFKPKWKHSNWKVREAAVAKITDQTLLIDIAKNDKESLIRTTAIINPNLTSQETLIFIAKNDEEWRVRQVAVRKITNQAALSDIAETDENSDVRRTAALSKLTDQDELAKIAKEKNSDLIGVAAIDKISDHGLLADVSRNALDDVVRAAAAKKLAHKVLVKGEIATTKKDKESDALKATDEGIINWTVMSYHTKGKPLNVIIFRHGQDQPPYPEQYFRWIVNQRYGEHQPVGVWQIFEMQDTLTIAEVKSVSRFSHYGQQFDEWEGPGPDGRDIVVLFFEP